MLWRHLYIKVLLRLWRRNICRASIQNRVESQEALIHASSSVAPMKALRGLTKLLCCSTGRQKHNLRTVSPRASLNTRRQTDQMVKLIIDTDPGVDDAMAILAAFNCEEDIEIVGITSLFGNVPVGMATENCLILRDMMSAVKESAASIPVCAGSSTSFLGEEKHRIADFVHGNDGFGNKGPKEKSTASASSESAADFLVRELNERPGEITILALAACTNVALALKKDPELHTKWKELVVLGGAFHINGNVNPAAEANILGDAEAADYVFAKGTNTYVVGLDVTMDCSLTREQLESLRGRGRYGTFLADISEFYCDFHFKCYNKHIVYMHDPAAMLAVIRKDLFDWEQGPALVAMAGPMRGKTLVDLTKKNWFEPNMWMDRPKINVAIKVKSQDVSDLCMDLMTR